MSAELVGFLALKDASPYTMNRFRFIMPSRPGFGRSDIDRSSLDDLRAGSCGCSAGNPNGKAYMSHFLKDTKELIDALGLKSFSVMGTSFGGPHGLALASAFQGDPRLRMTAIVNGVWGPGGKEGVKSCEKGDMGFATVKALSFILPIMPSSKMKDDMLPCDAEIWDEMGPCIVPYFSECFLQGAWPMTAEMVCNVQCAMPVAELDSIKSKVTVLTGTLDLNVPLRHSELMVKLLPNAELKVFDGQAAGHFSIWYYKLGDIFQSVLYD